MSTILVIEPSATLRFGVRRAIHLPGLELQEEADSAQALVRLSSMSGQSGCPDAIILGWPARATSELHELATVLCDPPCNRIPLMLMVQDTQALNGLALLNRKATLIQHWRNLEETTANLQQMLLAHNPPNITEQEQYPVHVLLVDDSKTIRTQFGGLLRKEGYRVTLTGTAAEAYKVAKQQPIDIAIVDYYMPEENGDVLCQRLKRDPATRHIELAVLTGNYDDVLVTAVLASGATECMFKNESSRLFLARVKALVRSCEQRRIIAREKQQLDNILDSVGDGVYGVDMEGIVTFINPAALKLLGYDRESDLLGQSAHALFHYADVAGNPVDPRHCFLQQAYQLGDELLQWETQFQTARGTAISVECSVRPRHFDGYLAGSVVAFRDISERLLFEEELKWQVNHDHLTKLLNRQYLEQALEQEIRRLFRTGETSALLFIDIDRFKQINDLAGHAAGDQLLIEVSNKLKQRVRQSDLIARVSGDEFVVILHNVKQEKAYKLAENLREILDEAVFQYGERVFDITGSIGMTMIDASSFSAERVLANADSACHTAKCQGRNRIHLFDEDKDISPFDKQEQGWISRLTQALEKGRFQLAFQPVFATYHVQSILENCDTKHDGQSNLIDAIECRCDFYEVQIQLPDAQGNPLPAAAFLPAAERFDLIGNIDCYVIKRVVNLIRRQSCNGCGSMAYAVSISEQTLLQHDFVTLLDNLVSEAGVAPEALLFSLRENHPGSHAREIQAKLTLLYARGFGVILGEQVRGYTALTHLRQLHASHITINENFIDGLPTDPIDQAVVRAIVDVSHAQKRKTIARHVENLETCQALAHLKVDYLQGDFLAQAISESELEQGVTVQPARQIV
ncbi:diguanylate cyclase domain-containing protein [Sedimenticola sp.]|uniref:two-component system response regulator n=1 Tax=Sedimenticola sp. TaxID=1940285 RepID=UPI003D0F9ABC